MVMYYYACPTTKARDSEGSWKPLKSLNETNIPDIEPGFQRHLWKSDAEI